MSVFLGQGVAFLDIVTVIVVLVATWFVWDMWMKGLLRFGSGAEEEESTA